MKPFCYCLRWCSAWWCVKMTPKLREP